MTKLSTLLLLAILIMNISAHADDTKFYAAMKKNMELMGSAKSVADYQAIANGFTRIGDSEKSRWEPYYYAALSYVLMTTVEENGEKKDVYLDEALEFIEASKAQNADGSEIAALEGFANMMRITIDPPSRGPRFAGLAVQAFQKALELNPENPRALGLLAQMQAGTAQFFGSPLTEACNTAKLAIEKFQTYKSENPVAPTWGKSMVDGMKDMCK